MQPRFGTPRWATLWTLVVLGFPCSAWAAAEEGAEVPPAVEAKGGEPASKGAGNGLAALVRIKLPLVAGSDAGLKLAITRARDQLVQDARNQADGRRPTLVLEIVPATNTENNGAGSEFEPAYALARLLTSRDLSDVKTVAWLPRSIQGHGVLVAMACEEIVMASDAEIGGAGVDEPVEEGGPSETVIAAYRETAGTRLTIPAALAVGMIDSSVEVVQIESGEGLRFVLRDEVEDFRRDHEVIKEDVLKPAGALARFTGREGRQFGFVKYLAAEKKDVARALAVPAESLTEDRVMMAAWQAIVIDIKGEVTPQTASQFKTLVTNRVSAGVNWVGVRIDSVGGDLPACLDIAATLASFDPNTVRTVAYVPVEARGGAAVIALACDQLVMHPTATLGAGPQAALAEPAQPPAAGDMRQLPPAGGGRRQRPQPPQAQDEAVQLAAAVASIRDSLAARTERSWSLLAAMLDARIDLANYRNKATGEERVMSGEEAAALPDAVNWNRGAALAANNAPLALSGAQAAAASVAWHTVDNFDQLKRLYGIERVETVEPNWALTLVQALASPGLATFLLFIGFIGLYIELKTPGVGVGGVISLLAFMLFFWANYLEGTAGSLEILMFVCGLVLLLLEVFVAPGVGIFGLTGGLMVLFSLVLASQTFVIPHTEAEFEQVTESMGLVVAAGVGMVVLALALRKFLPKAPIFNRLVLEPPAPEERITLSHREATADFSHLVGRVGEAITDLLPAGKALIDEELIDVIAQGEPIDRGQAVVVVSAHANRVVVRPA
jgi:membrane-bound serine protease (ClpP class)